MAGFFSGTAECLAHHFSSLPVPWFPSFEQINPGKEDDIVPGDIIC